MRFYIIDKVVKSVVYEHDSLQQENCFDVHSIVGTFLHNKAVCDGFAKAFKILCNEFGIKYIVVLEKTDKKGDFSGDNYHAYNWIGKTLYTYA